jgi:hypothetical protein
MNNLPSDEKKFIKQIPKDYIVYVKDSNVLLKESKTKLYEKIFQSNFNTFFTLAKKYSKNKKERESLLFSRLCLELILRRMFIIHVKRGDITYTIFEKSLGADNVTRLAGIGKIKNKRRVCSFCNVLSSRDMIKILNHINKLGNRSDGNDSIYGWVIDIDECANKGVHINIERENLNILDISKQSEAVVLFLENLVSELEKI